MLGAGAKDRLNKTDANKINAISIYECEEKTFFEH